MFTVDRFSWEKLGASLGSMDSEFSASSQIYCVRDAGRVPSNITATVEMLRPPQEERKKRWHQS